ncbi:Type II iodothyronine deiodinase [Dissostichus eleginoides]|uniref:Iodothyronine deiodinase n=2 Tax=Notothenioidei TaxID=8205 RepID=A0AAD9C2E0_DISEL|nr:Type II iodothyronine deiodinase [Dissostichus eleginoides]
MGMASEDLLVTLQILPGFFSNCLFLALYDSVVLVKRAVSLLSCSRPAGSGERPRMLTSAGLRSIWNSFLLDAYKQVKLGCEAPNSKVVKVPDGLGRGSSLSDKADVPPGAIAGTRDDHLPAFRQLVEDFSEVADFLLVYIDEAHPSDGWVAPPMGSCAFNVQKHQNLEERLGAARKLIEHFSLPPQCQLVADCMDNNANVAYGVSNERVCIVQQRKIAYLGGKGPFFYNLKDVKHWLEQSYGKR